MVKKIKISRTWRRHGNKEHGICSNQTQIYGFFFKFDWVWVWVYVFFNFKTRIWDGYQRYKYPPWTHTQIYPECKKINLFSLFI